MHFHQTQASFLAYVGYRVNILLLIISLAPNMRGTIMGVVVTPTPGVAEMSIHGVHCSLYSSAKPC